LGLSTRNLGEHGLLHSLLGGGPWNPGFLGTQFQWNLISGLGWVRKLGGSGGSPMWSQGQNLGKTGNFTVRVFEPNLGKGREGATQFCRMVYFSPDFLGGTCGFSTNFFPKERGEKNWGNYPSNGV